MIIRHKFPFSLGVQAVHGRQVSDKDQLKQFSANKANYKWLFSRTIWAHGIWGQLIPPPIKHNVIHNSTLGRLWLPIERPQISLFVLITVMIDDEEKLSKDRYTRWTRSLSARKIKKKDRKNWRRKVGSGGWTSLSFTTICYLVETLKKKLSNILRQKRHLQLFGQLGRCRDQSGCFISAEVPSYNCRCVTHFESSMHVWHKLICYLLTGRIPSPEVKSLRKASIMTETINS